MNSISSFDAMAIVNPPEHTDKPSLTVVTPVIEIADLMARAVRGLAPVPDLSRPDDYILTTEEEYRSAEIDESGYLDLSDDNLVDLSNVRNNVENLRSCLSKPDGSKASHQEQRESPPLETSEEAIKDA